MTGVDCSGFDSRADRESKIGARHDDERVAASELKHALLDFTRGHTANDAAGSLAAGQRHCLDSWIDNYFLGLLGFHEQRLKSAFVEAGATKDLLDGQRALWDVRGVLEDPDVAGH